jgi:GH15 family glucan-1,4-alpha-glucosidase
MPQTAIADHGLIGNLQTAALVGTDGAIDWFCCPRFDSPSVFGALLDPEHGGAFRIAPAGTGYRTRQMYYPDTAVLITRFLTEAGVGEVVDFMPPLGREPSGHHRLVRLVRCVRGRMLFHVTVAPRFDYGRAKHLLEATEHGAVFTTDDLTLTLHAVRDPGDQRLGRVRIGGDVDRGEVRLSVELTAGLVRGVVLDSAGGPPREIPVAEAVGMFDDTVAYWRNWLATSTYTGRWRETVERSAITLKLMTYAPTGALVAAPTMGLPEQLGGERNWDYRYTWVRDASFSVYALLELGFVAEAAQLGEWLGDRVRERATGAAGPLHIMYRVDGSADLAEEVLPHWSGYRDSRPVRIGNDAADQLQLDIYGEALDSIYAADRAGVRVPHEGWRAIRDVLDWLAGHWDQPEEGIWETRGGRQEFTYGRLMCWVAFDRGIRLAESRGYPAPIARWRRERDRVQEQVLTRGWHPQRHAFVQHYDTDVLDSALLRMPTVGFVAPRDPQWLATLDAMDAELVTDSLVYRYNPATSPDGLRGSEGTFSLCTFAYVTALAKAAGSRPRGAFSRRC